MNHLKFPGETITHHDHIIIDDQDVERVEIYKHGHVIQVNCFDGDLSALVVWVDHRIQNEMTLSQVTQLLTIT